MAWSYRSDRSDEVYAKTSGPAVAETEQLPRPPSDGEDTDNVLNPEKSEKKRVETEAEKNKPVDPEAGPPPPPKLEGIPQEVIEKEKLGPAAAPSAEEQQEAIDKARGAAEKKETKAEHAANAKK